MLLLAALCIWLALHLVAANVLMVVVAGSRDVPGSGTGTSRFIFEPRDLWIGIFWDHDDRGKLQVYLCPFPAFVIHVFNRPDAPPHNTKEKGDDRA